MEEEDKTSQDEKQKSQVKSCTIELRDDIQKRSKYANTKTGQLSYS